MEPGSQEVVEAQKICVACGREFSAKVELCPDDGILLTPIGNEPKVGDIFAERYEILGIIGDGGMGKVYRARHNLMKRVVAIKLLLPHLVSSASALKRFQQEAQAASALNHPNILTVYDFGISEQSMPFLVMDFLEGTSLANLIQEKGHLEIGRCLNIFTQACSGLAHAHQKGVIHRDLKPANMMLIDYDGQTDFLKIVDFGIAKLRLPENSDAEPLTHTGEVFGSPLYMSPEQCRGLDLDTRSDIYSLGCVLYRTLTGRPAFAGRDAMECMYKQVNDEAIAFNTCCPELNLPEDLEKIVFKAMAKDPNDRYQNMTDFRNALEELVSQYPAGSKPSHIFSVPPNSEMAVSTVDLTDKLKNGAAALEPKEEKIDPESEAVPESPAPAPQPATSHESINIASSNSLSSTNVASAIPASAMPTQTETVAEISAKKPIPVIWIAAALLVLGGIVFVANSTHNAKEADIPASSVPLTGDPNKQADTLISESKSLVAQGDYAGSIKALERALKYTDEMNNPNDYLLKILPDLARAYSQCDRFESAQHTLERLIPLRKKALGANSIAVAKIKTNIALSLIAQGNLDDAVPFLNEAKSAYKNAKPSEREGYSDVLYGLAKVKTQQGQYAQAISTLNQAIALKDKESGKDSADAAAYMDDLAQVYLLQNKLGQAESLLNKVLAIKQARLGNDSIQAADTLKNLGTLDFQKGDLNKSESMFNKALAIKSKDLGADSLGAAEIMTALAMLYTREQKYDQADKLFKQALNIRSSQLGADAPSVKRTKELYAVLQQKMQHH